MNCHRLVLGDSRRSRAVLLSVLAISCLGAERPKGFGEIVDVRSWSYPDYTRVVVELSTSIRLQSDSIMRLPPDAAFGKAERLYLDLPSVWAGHLEPREIAVEDGLLRRIRVGQNRADRTRIVLDLENYAEHRLRTLHSPDRVVIDVYGTPREKPVEAPSRVQGSTEQSSRLSMESRRLTTVVIDPGHGGRDPGATGVGGVLEKDVNLKLAKFLARRLKARSFRVIMTRESDRYIDLEERTALAESSRGDLFVSIHANASKNRSLRGIEIYYLDKNHERHSMELAARENGVDLDEVDDLQQTMSRLRLSEASSQSRKVAEFVHEDLFEGLGQTYGTMSDLGVKKGPFHVLFLSSMPAILVESGFLTNRDDVKLLESERYLDTLAAQIAAGLGHYRNSGRQANVNSSRPPVGAR